MTTKRFTGQYHESSLPGGEGLSYYNARWYDPQVGRFLSADTLVPQPTNPQAFNRYSYVINNPLKYVDPTGHTFAMIDPGPGGGGRPQPNHTVGVQKPKWWPPFLPYTWSYPRSFQKPAVVSWISQNNIPTTIGVQAGLDTGVGYWLGVTSGGEIQASFNWWSGELAYTFDSSSAVRSGPPSANVGTHLGITLTAGASDIRNAVIGAALFTSVDGSIGTPIARVSVGGAGTWSRAYAYNDLNNDKQFGNGNGRTEPLTGPYMDPVFRRTVDSLALNLTGNVGLSSSPGLDGGISGGMTDVNEWFVIDTYDYIRPVLRPFQVAGEWLWGK